MTNEYRERLNSLLSHTEKAKVKQDLFVYLKDKVDSESKDVDLAPVIFGPILESLLTDTIISMSKLFEVGRSHRNIKKFLNFSISNRTKIKWKDELSSETIKKTKRKNRTFKARSGKYNKSKRQIFCT
jgi:hypothetical protein